jgi:predicted dehydrogenase
MAVSHIEAIRDNPVLDPVAAYDADGAARAAFCTRWSVPEAGSWSALLDCRPDIVLIASPTATHADYLRRALAGGVALVACEKPLVESAQSAGEIVEHYRRSGASLLVFYPRRWIRALAEAEAEIRAGAFGGLLAGHGWYGNGVRNIGVHMVDLVQRTVGPVVAVDRAGKTAPELADDPTVDFALILDSGRRILLQGYDYDAYALFELDLLFERARLRIADLGFAVERWTKGESPHYPGFFEPVAYQRVPTDYADAARSFWTYAVDVLSAGRPIVDGGDVGILSVVDAAIAAARDGEMKRVGTRH